MEIKREAALGWQLERVWRDNGALIAATHTEAAEDVPFASLAEFLPHRKIRWKWRDQGTDGDVEFPLG